MANVRMQKPGLVDLWVDPSQVANHIKLGWSIATISLSGDMRTLTIPDSSSESMLAGMSTIAVMMVAHYSINPKTVAADSILAATTLAAAAATITDGLSNPDVPRTLTATGNATGITGNVVITGRDANGQLITDTIAVLDATTVEGVVAFATVISIALPAKTNVSGDTVSVGYAKHFGMPQILVNASYLLVKLFNGSADTGTLALDAALSKNLFALTGTPNGTKALDLIYLV
jgi:hypothetical protein